VTQGSKKSLQQSNAKQSNAVGNREPKAFGALLVSLHVPSTKSGRKWSRFSAGCESSIAICTRNALPLHAMSDATCVAHTYPVEKEFSQMHVIVFFGRFDESAEQRDEFLHTLTGPPSQA
jgi:hypothetical protein